MDKIKTGNMIREARTKKNLTQSELGSLLGVSNKAVSRWENGDSFPDIGVLENLSTILDLKVQDLVSGEMDSQEQKAINDVIHIAKLQNAEKSQKTSTLIIGSILELVCLWTGISGLKGTYYLSHSTVFFVLTMLIAYSAVLYLSTLKQVTAPESPKKDLWLSWLSLIIFAISSVFTWVTSILLVNDIYLFSISLYQVGAVIDVFFRLLFVIAMCILTYDLLRLIKNQTIFGTKNIFTIGAIFSIAVYCDLFYRMSDRESVLSNLMWRTLLVLGGLAVTFVIRRIFIIRHEKAYQSSQYS